MHMHDPAVRIEADAYYDDAALRLLLALPSATLARARREARLRYVRHGRTIYHLGAWVRDWLEDRTPSETRP